MEKEKLVSALKGMIISCEVNGDNNWVKEMLEQIVTVIEKQEKEILELREKSQAYEEFLKIESYTKHYKDLEYRLFKQSVRKYVDEDTYKRICDLYNQAVDLFRKGKQYSVVKEFIEGKGN